ncbi:hypothetical protein AGABI2DRAFT_186236 [Agaricus bisporus var. bisporus H97]|uniref:hypothetical protein n=1 Tax=Agaricus bisporus var. bisporus (strain H97 / ATCC MYA-4626 / FGSC 10389) TaxID=936046 RepID=UPI00029F6927|nr:hypothetical protein AGABI2DRAFT_186236 [Agaricus bisporus var. bisporus H97]EKV46905.1 hypothetical protein AGABI2DRAFT_186236 [Agaricus bisporus var. bisporus H97]
MSYWQIYRSNDVGWCLSAPGKRLAALKQVRAAVFQTAFNPTNVRTGAKYLRRHLRGPAMVAYYPPKIDIAAIVRQYLSLEMVNEDEQTRLEDIKFKKKRGKGAPKKAKTKSDSRRAGKRR